MARAHTAGALSPPDPRRARVHSGTHTCVHSTHAPAEVKPYTPAQAHTCMVHKHVCTHVHQKHRRMCTCVWLHTPTPTAALTCRHVLGQEGLLACVYSHGGEHTHTHTNANACKDLNTHKHMHTPHCSRTVPGAHGPAGGRHVTMPPSHLPRTHSRGPWMPSRMLITSRGGATSWHR